MLQAHKTVMGRKQAHLLHRDQVVVDSKRAALEDRGKLMLARCNLVVLGLCRDAELPELVVELLHELVHGRTDGAEVVLLELLALGRLAAEEGAAREDQVRTLLVVVLLDQEVLLLRADGREDAVRILAEEGKHTLCLLLECDLGTQKRRLLVESLARVGDEGRRDAEHLVLDEGRRGRIPDRVAAGLERGTKAARREARCIRLTLDKLLAAEGHEHGAVFARVDERVMLLGRDAGEWLEPVRVVGRTMLERPLLHRMGNLVRDIDVQRIAVLDDGLQLLVGRLR